MLTARHPDDGPPLPHPRLRGVLEVAALLLLAAVGLVVTAFAVQACA